MAKKEEAPKVVLERVYNVHLRREFQKVASWRRTEKAVTALRNFISKKLFRKVYKDLSSKRERDNVDARLKEEYELEYERQGEAIIEEGLPDKISPPDKVMITEQLAVLATQIKINQYLK